MRFRPYYSKSVALLLEMFLLTSLRPPHVIWKWKGDISCRQYFIYFSSIFSSNFWVNLIFLIVCIKLNFILMLLGNSFTINMHWRSLKFWYRNFKGHYKTPRKQTKQSYNNSSSSSDDKSIYTWKKMKLWSIQVIYEVTF